MDTTKETKHTPGPLRTEGRGIFTADGRFLGKPIETIGVTTEEETDANAILWAAAPDLLKALETHPLPPDDFDTLDGQEAFCDCIMQWLNGPVAAAIAKAKGTTCPS